MKVIYTRTMRVKDDGLGKAMEVGKGLAAVRKKHFPNHEVYFSFQMGGDPRTIRETLIGTMFEGENMKNYIVTHTFKSKEAKAKMIEVTGSMSMDCLLYTSPSPRDPH